MHPYGTYTLLGGILFLISIFSLSVYLQPAREGIAEFVSRQIKRAMGFCFLVLLFLLFLWMVGIWLLINPSNLALALMGAGAVGLWAVLVVINAVMTYTLIKNNYRPVLSKDLIDIVVYFAVLYMVLERFDFPWITVGVASTILSVAIIYLLSVLVRYSRIFDIIVEPVNLYTLALGFRVFSGLIGLLLISFDYSENVFKELIVFSYLFFASVMLYTIREVGALLKVDRKKV